MSDAAPALHALLIGIDYYAPNRLSDGSTLEPLRGAVRDIRYIEQVLRAGWGLVPERTHKLTATYVDTFPLPPPPPPEPPAQQPTYANMIAAFQALTAQAAPGDLVYIHYSGHGSRAPTMVPRLKGADALDETLVPQDLGLPGGRYLHDIELAALLQAMVDKGLVVTVVLDSCHSGGATRAGATAVPRGTGTIDRTPRPAPSLVGTPEALAAIWQARRAGPAPPTPFGAGWLPAAAGYVVLAACAPTEAALETMFDTGRHGVLTYWLADSLQKRRPDLTYRQLYGRLLGQVHSQFANQTPQLDGEADRFVLGSDQAPPLFTIPVLAVNLARERVRLLTGEAQGLRAGAHLAIYPPEARDLNAPAGRLALVTLLEPGATESWATIQPPLPPDPIAVGSRARLLDLGAAEQRRAVRLGTGADAPAGGEVGAALARVATALAQGGSGWLRLAEADVPAVYQVTVDAAGAYQIADAAGQPLPNVRPALPAADPASAARLVGRLVHLATYDNIRRLDNPDPGAALAGTLRVELLQAPGYDPEDPGQAVADYLRPLAGNGVLATVPPGTVVYLRVTNGAPVPLNIAVLDLQPDWAITQSYPQRADYQPLDASAVALVPFQVTLPPGAGRGTDTFKVLATTGPISYRWLELPPLDQSPAPQAAKGAAPTDPLEMLLAALADPSGQGAGGSRDALLASLRTDWTASQVEVQSDRGDNGSLSRDDGLIRQEGQP